MAVTPQDEAQLEVLFGASDAAPEAFAEARKVLGGLRLTKCDPSDMGVEEPFKIYPHFDIYLLDTRDHCAHVTAKPEDATGLIVVYKP